MQRRFITFFLVLFWHSIAFADIDFVFNEITQTEKRNTINKMASEWMNNNDYPVKGEDGKIVYLFGTSMPILVCTPLKVSQIELERGEQLTEAPQIGDSVRWHLTPLQSGQEGGKTTTIIVKPIEENIETNLVLATNKRMYTIKLISDPENYTPKISFKYPGNEVKKWQQLIKKEKERKIKDTIPQTNEDVACLNFEYQIEGYKPYKPIRIYNNGQNTIIHMPKMLTDSMPVLLTYSNSNELVNYRIKENVFIVDQIFKKAILFSGVGKNKKQVTISYLGES